MSDEIPTDNPIVFLVQRGDDALRSAETLIEMGLVLDGLSRAYYAALHYARALLISIDVVPKSHKGVLTLLSLHFVKTGELAREMGTIFSILQKIREDSDYEIGTFYDQDEARKLLDDTRTFCVAVAGLLNGRRSFR